MKEAKKEHIFALRMPASTDDLAREIAALEGISINQFICAAVVEKIADLEGKTKPARRRVRPNGQREPR